MTIVDNFFNTLRKKIVYVFIAILVTSCAHKTTVVDTPPAGLPANYPIREVPVVEGQVVENSDQYDSKTRTWTFAIIAHGENILPRAKKKLEDVGFTSQPPDAAPLGPSGRDGIDVVLRLKSPKYMVTISSSTGLSVPTINYQVTQTSIV